MLGMSEHYAASGNLEGSAIKETQKAFLGTKRRNTLRPIHVLGLALAGNPRSLRYLQSHFYAMLARIFWQLGKPWQNPRACVPFDRAWFRNIFRYADSSAHVAAIAPRSIIRSPQGR